MPWKTRSGIDVTSIASLTRSKKTKNHSIKRKYRTDIYIYWLPCGCRTTCWKLLLLLTPASVNNYTNI